MHCLPSLHTLFSFSLVLAQNMGHGLNAPACSPSGVHSVPGLPKPDVWQDVVDKETGLIYFYNPKTGKRLINADFPVL